MSAARPPGPWSGPTPPPGGWPGPPPARHDAPNAITALVLGILGVTMLPVVCSIPAIVIGGQAKRAAAAEPWRYSPDSARIAVVLGWVGLGIGVLMVGAFLVWLLFVAAIVGIGVGVGA